MAGRAAWEAIRNKEVGEAPGKAAEWWGAPSAAFRCVLCDSVEVEQSR